MENKSRNVVEMYGVAARMRIKILQSDRRLAVETIAEKINMNRVFLSY